MVKNRTTKLAARAVKASTGTVYPRSLAQVLETLDRPFTIPFTGLFDGVGDGSHHFEPERDNHLLLLGWHPGALRAFLAATPKETPLDAWIVDAANVLSADGGPLLEAPHVRADVARGDEAIRNMLSSVEREVDRRLQLLEKHQTPSFRDLPTRLRPRPAVLGIIGWENLAENYSTPGEASVIGRIIHEASRVGLFLVVADDAVDRGLLPGGHLLDAKASRLQLGASYSPSTLLRYTRPGWRGLNPDEDEAIYEPFGRAATLLKVHGGYYSDGAPFGGRIVPGYGSGVLLPVGTCGGEDRLFSHSQSAHLTVSGPTAGIRRETLKDMVNAAPSTTRVIVLAPTAEAPGYASLRGRPEVPALGKETSDLMDEILVRQSALRDECNANLEVHVEHDLPGTVIVIDEAAELEDPLRHTLEYIGRLAACTGVSLVMAAAAINAPWKKPATGETDSGARFMAAGASHKDLRIFFPPEASMYISMGPDEAACFWDSNTIHVLDPVPA